MPAAASASAAAHRTPSSQSTSPSPISTSAQCAKGARSPLAPSDPCSGTTGVMPAFSSPAILSASTGRAPEKPIARLRARSSIIARTTSRSTAGPTPAACERTTARWSSSRRSAGMRTVASDPNPVETPYAGSVASLSDDTTAALASIAARAASVSSTRTPSRATAITSPGVRPRGPSATALTRTSSPARPSR